MTATVITTKIGDVEGKMSDIRSLVTTTALNTKTGEVEKKIPDHFKYITTTEFNKFADTIFGKKIRPSKISSNY